MSLILAQVSQNFGWFVGDTLLTHGLPRYYSADDINSESHALKIHILNEKICIAMAGEVELAMSVINQAGKLIENKTYILDNTLFDKICEIYKKECTPENLNACNFLVMVISEGGNILVKIENGEWSLCQKAYIGDSRVYRNLQQKRIPHKSFSPIYNEDGSSKLEPTILSEIEKEFIEIDVAMEKISGRAIDSTVGLIGDNVVRVGINSKNTFQYFGKAYTNTSFVETEVKKRIEANLLISSNPKYGLGIYYSEGLVGYLFISGDSVYCRKIQVSDLQDFKTKAKEFSLELN